MSETAEQLILDARDRAEHYVEQEHEASDMSMSWAEFRSHRFYPTFAGVLQNLIREQL